MAGIPFPMDPVYAHIPATPYRSHAHPPLAFPTPSAPATPGVGSLTSHAAVDDILFGCEDFLGKFEAWAAAKRKDMEEKRVEHFKTCEELRENEIQLRKAIDVAQTEAKERQQALDKQQQEALARESEVAELRTDKEERRATRDELAHEMRKITAEIQRRKQGTSSHVFRLFKKYLSDLMSTHIEIQNKTALEQRREQEEIELQRNKPELELYRQMLAMEIKTVANDVLRFEFTHINDADWDEKYYFTIDISVRGVYTVTECSPMLPDLALREAWIRRSNDFYGFLKLMRKGFAEYVKAQKTSRK
ncbi:kinetochore-associated Ndc80 complex subunit spc25 [Borealophlyctis nickersoniae]|nr:kinetochore-associated Ndc80 complex subunit spc25 [Borealophlyctis nickersoniae]